MHAGEGKPENIKTPLLFTGAMSIIAPTVGHDFFNKIAHRICNHFGLQSLSEIDSLPKEFSYAYGALIQAWSIEWRTKEIRTLADDFSSQSPEHYDAFRTRSLVDDAIFLGYSWGKAESDLTMKTLAESAIRSKAGSSLGGAKSGGARRKKRSNTWEPTARQMAKSVREKEPRLSQDDVATKIILEWPDQNSKPPGHVTLKTLISRMEASGELPKKQRI